MIKILQLNSHFSNKNAFLNKNIKKKIKLYTKKLLIFTKNKNKNFDNGLLFEKEAIISLQEKINDSNFI